ncbi:MAG: 50S ribosomal protein L11 methyltransferase [Wenzhouxiangellaceae bacterium]|nr:50S ribosomal protein L11 methyltransferase [Wenzhouxiangellaceae bacterium]
MTTTVRFTIDSEKLERAEEALWGLGAQSIDLADAGDEPLLEPGPGETPVWRHAEIQALLPDPVVAETVLLTLAARGLIQKPGDVQFDSLAERDWERAWMDQFRPMRFGQSIWICPSHVQPEPDWEVVVRLDPGLAFGTGTHPTTALCLEWMDSVDFSGTTVVDYGCGSGVLAVAAALKGARRVIAIDHDRQALLASVENAERNGVGSQIETGLPGQLESLQADAVIANILAGPLIALAPRLIDLLRPGAKLVLSGILAEQAESVSQAYRSSLQFVSADEREQWMRLVFQLPDDSGIGPKRSGSAAHMPRR